MTGLTRRRKAELELFNKVEAELIKEAVTVAKERDIHVVSPWAKDIWEEMTKKGYFDGKRPGAPITREEVAAVISRLFE